MIHTTDKEIVFLTRYSCLNEHLNRNLNILKTIKGVEILYTTPDSKLKDWINIDLYGYATK